MNYRSYSDLNEVIKKHLYLLNGKFDLIVGIPRSGMVPAYMIALFLNLDCVDVGSLVRNDKIMHGLTRKTNNNLIYPHDAKSILLVDDSIDSGNSLQRALHQIPPEIRSKLKTMAVYSSQKKRNDVDMFFEVVLVPRVFEWNIFHHPATRNFGFDIDGILCVDPTEEENDDGPKYLKFIREATPLLKPHYKINALVSNRLEKYRQDTVAWLAANKIDYDHLILLNVSSKEERWKNGLHSAHKALYYKNSGLDLFIESSSEQSLKIAQLSGKPVYCFSNNHMYQPGLVNELIKQPERALRSLYRRCKTLVKAF